MQLNYDKSCYFENSQLIYELSPNIKKVKQ